MVLTRRGFAVGASGAAMLASIPARAKAPFDAVVGSAATGIDAPVFTTLPAFLASDIGQSEKAARVFVAAGDYRGQFQVHRPNLTLIGAGQDRTKFKAGAYAGQRRPDGTEVGTFGSAVVLVDAPDFRAEGLTFENTFDAPAEQRKPDGLKADLGGTQQAIALSLGKGADRAVLIDCGMHSHQDTLYCADDRQLFSRCRISGSYDFIFGGSSARFEDCDIVSRPRLEPVEGYITAPSTPVSRQSGLVFDRCLLMAEPGVPDDSVFLGRPWRPNDRAVGMATYLDCVMGPHIAPAGWTNMWYGNPQRFFEPEDARFAEYGSRGPGADGQRRGKVLTARQARSFTRKAMFGDWNPSV